MLALFYGKVNVIRKKDKLQREKQMTPSILNYGFIFPDRNFLWQRISICSGEKVLLYKRYGSLLI